MAKKIFINSFLSLVLMAVTVGCSAEIKVLPQGAYQDEILTTKPVEQDKTMITVRVESGISQADAFERIVEEKFPQVDIVLRSDGSINSRYTIRADAKAEVECDFILSRRLPAMTDIASEYLLDLSAEDFVGNYYISAVDSCTDSSGNLYFLPGSSNVYGIVYDKTLFDENGWELPHSYSEFVQLVDTINSSDLKTQTEDGILNTVSVKAIQSQLMYPDAFQILFNTYGYEDAFSGTENFLWLNEYQNGNGSMIGHMETVTEKFCKLFDDGILSLSDFEVTPSQRSNMFYSKHTTAMIIECQNAVSYSENFDNSHEIAMMPFWTSDDDDSDYLYSIPSYYMAINKNSAEESKTKKELLLDIYSYISSVEGQTKLLDDTFQVSNVKGVSLENNIFSSEIIETISDGRIINTFYYASGETNEQVEREMLKNASDMVEGNISVTEWLASADKVRDDYISGNMEKETVYGQSETTLTRLETVFTIAEMYRTMTGADIGIASGGFLRNGTNGRFYQGDITSSSIDCINPNKEPKTQLDDEWDEKIITVSMTGAEILDILNNVYEDNLSIDNSECQYYIASGLTVEYNPWANAGEKVISCKLPNGDEIDTSQTYKVAYFEGSLPNDNFQPESALEKNWKECFLDYLEEIGGVIKKPDMTINLVYDTN